MMDPNVAGSLILSLGGVLLAVCGIIVVRAMRAPAFDRARLDGLERLQASDAKRLEELVLEANAAAVAARRLATKRLTKKERELLGKPDDEEDDAPAAPPVDGRPRVIGADGQAYIPGETLQEHAARVALEQRTRRAG